MIKLLFSESLRMTVEFLDERIEIFEGFFFPTLAMNELVALIIRDFKFAF